MGCDGDYVSVGKDVDDADEEATASEVTQPGNQLHRPRGKGENPMRFKDRHHHRHLIFYIVIQPV